MIQLLEAKDVDLIAPFPLTQLKRMYGWCKAYKSLTETDYDPHTWEEFEARMKEVLPACASWGIIDKNHLTNDRHPAPLIGSVVFERTTPTNGYFHVSTTRRAWGSGLIDQAVNRIIDELFEVDPILTRVSAWMLQRNHLAQGLSKRLGFTFEGIIRNMVVQGGRPKNIVHFGLTKENWQCRKQQSWQDLASGEACSVESERGETKPEEPPKTNPEPPLETV